VASIIYLIRHGETEWTLADRMQGALDSPLSDRGKAQAAIIGDILRAELARQQPFSVHCSPLGRARQTADIICARLEHRFDACRIDERLREATWGQWDGLTPDEIEKHTPGGLAARHRDKWNYVPPDGENYAMAGERAAAWLREFGGDGVAVVVCHGITGKLLRGLYLGLTEAEITRLDQPQDAVYRLQGGSITRLEADEAYEDMKT
jgi:probable phosphoglycerate mutase